jgi:hypothetical protein
VSAKLVHFDYNNILPRTDADWERQHAESVLGAARRYGYRESVFHDCRKDAAAAVESIRKAVNESSAESPLYFILAGPMEVPYQGIERSDPARRKFVYCLSHNRWNDGYAGVEYLKHNKRHVIALGVKWVQITDQNPFLSTSPYGRPARPDEWRAWEWMKASGREEVRFLWDRMRATTRADCSDAGMAWFLLTGDERPEVPKLRKLLDDKVVPTPVEARRCVRLEAENFRTLDVCRVASRSRATSQRLSVVLAAGARAGIATPLDEPYTAARGRYDVGVRYCAGGGRCRFALHVAGRQRGEAWEASPADAAQSPAGPAWATRTIPDVEIGSGDEIMVEVRDASGGEEIDYVELNYLGAEGRK